ncbi:MAG TPA: hypothetical protein VE987_22870 [Polyangiaceae bacterium]|nr:hypothetical protein [Polyangiaceae bacterium]
MVSVDDSSVFWVVARRRCRAWAVVGSLAAVAAGCNGILGNQLYGLDDASIHSAPEGGSSDGTLDAPSEAAAADGSSDGRPNDATLDAGGPADASVDQDADGHDGAADASAETGAAQCVPGGGCTPGACQNGTWTCVDGGRVCQETTAVSNGTPCVASADDAGAHVCSAGQCVACNAGGDCSDPATPCVKKSLDCSTGTATCSVSQDVTDGTPCDAGLYCNGGVCSACQVGAPCAPPANPCDVGRVTACAGGVATCTDQGTPASAGAACVAAGAARGVCDGAGHCAACSPGAQCNPSGNPCQVGMQACTSGVACTMPAPVREGQTCGAGQICHSGACVACNAASCAGGCCDANGCVTTAQSPAECGTGAAGAACTTCPGPAAGTGNATCANDACGVTCSGSTPTLCGGACVDLTSDKNNCGRCGHPCQGGTCVASVCQPVPVVPASSTNFPYALAVDSSFVYWIEQKDGAQNSNNGSVKKAPISGGSTFTMLAGSQAAPQGIAVTPAGLFWINAGAGSVAGGLMFLAAGAASAVPVATAFNQPVAIAASATNVYWIDDTASGSGHSEAVLSLPVSPASALTASAAPAMLANAANCALAMAVNAADVFWIESGCFAGSGRVADTPVSLAGPVAGLLPTGTFLNGPYNNDTAVLFTAQARIGLDSNSVYFASTGASAEMLESVPVGGGPVTTLSATAMPNGVTVDANNVYWTDVSTVMSMPIAGGAATTLATGQNVPYDIVVDATSVYWVNFSSGGGVMKVAKP